MNEETNQWVKKQPTIRLKIICPTCWELINVKITLYNILQFLLYLILLLLIKQWEKISQLLNIFYVWDMANEII